MKYDDAIKKDSMTHQEALESPDIQVMDRAALGMAADGNMPIMIFKLSEDTIAQAASGDPIGTKVTREEY